MIQVIEKTLTKLTVILQTLQGWAIAVGVLLAEYFFADHGTVVWLVLAVTLLDAVWGIAVSVTHGQFTLSELMRLTVAKIAVYGCALAVFIGLDKVTGVELGTDVVGSAVILCEGWSMSASMLILFPHIPVLQLLKKALTGEIANKLRVDVEDVERAMREAGGRGTATNRTDANEDASRNANEDANRNANGNANENAKRDAGKEKKLMYFHNSYIV